MSKKRVTPEDDYERFADNLWGTMGHKIWDIESYNSAFDEYMDHDLTEEQDYDLRREGFEIIAQRHKSVIREHKGALGAGDKYRGAKFDKRYLRKPERFNGKKEEYKFIRQVYDRKMNIRKFVYARKVTIKRTSPKGKRYNVDTYRDRFGRFTGKVEAS